MANVIKSDITLPCASDATNYLPHSPLTTNTSTSSSTSTSFPYPTITIFVLSSLLLFSTFIPLLRKRIERHMERARRYKGFKELEQLLERRIMIRYLDSTDDSFSEEPYSDNTHSCYPSQPEQNEDLEAQNNGHNSVDSEDDLWLLVDYQMQPGTEWAENRVPLDEIEIARMHNREIEGEGGSPVEFWIWF